ncbi:LysR substrate-binding domain-containing protein [Asticcacaulis benevestitus]|uniref:HTH lysR-type domain-containing protein n=1 Tax=Asticcacaulis benevestitus DSM 16100 = ATCC BAA-896 TaxID=1121022 RepID=V4PAP9_9CAUL|nr:LysR substrate-binding domain-containing protein [Asticcacaulis benevestitus]ESQ90987.1 hypothetical protein ABENE_11085 [Asticcacaulis benevestitus DSM 16100 = ATCC BAA-896]
MATRRLPPLLAVRAFEAAARLGSLTRAADELGITQSGISYQVRLLEGLVQGPLFSKSGRGIVLTPLGERLAPSMTLALDSIAKAFAEIRPAEGDVLTVACTQTFGANWLALRIGRFQLLHPWLAVRVVANDQMADLEAGEADVALRNTSSPWPGLASDFLMRYPILPIASPEFLRRYATVDTPDDVLKLPRTTSDDPWWAVWHEAVTGQVTSQTAKGQLRFDSQLLDGNAAVAGHGVAMVNPLLWQRDIEEGRLIPVIKGWAKAKSDFWFCCLERRKGERKIRIFREWMKVEISSSIAELSARFEGLAQDIATYHK